VVPKSADDDKECAICLGSLTSAETTTLPCKHSFHEGCVSSMRNLSQNLACPVCRAEFPPGPERAFDEALRRFLVIERRLARESRAWAVMAKEERDEMEAVLVLLRGAASEGHAGAQYNLGVALAKGEGVAKDEVEAAKWYLKAAKQGLADAQFAVGMALANGKGVAKNEVEAAKWYRKAAKQGLARAQFAVGVALANGQGVAKDEVEAAKWLRKAAEQGFTNA